MIVPMSMMGLGAEWDGMRNGRRWESTDGQVCAVMKLLASILANCWSPFEMPT